MHKNDDEEWAAPEWRAAPRSLLKSDCLACQASLEEGSCCRPISLLSLMTKAPSLAGSF